MLAAIMVMAVAGDGAMEGQVSRSVPDSALVAPKGYAIEDTPLLWGCLCYGGAVEVTQQEL